MVLQHRIQNSTHHRSPIVIREVYPVNDRPIVYRNLTDRKYVAPKLNLGCGFRHIANVLNLDSNPNCEPDVLCDMERTPWSWWHHSLSEYKEDDHNLDDTFNYVCSVNTLEHVQNILGVMGQIWRVCKDGAVVELVVPNCFHQSAFEDPTHVRFFGPTSWQYWSSKVYTGRTTNTSWYSDDRFHFDLIDVNAFADADAMKELDILIAHRKQCESKELKDTIRLMEKHFKFYYTNTIHYLMFQLQAIKPLPSRPAPDTIRIYS